MNFRRFLIIFLAAFALLGEQAVASTVVTNSSGYQSWVDAVKRVPTPTTSLEVIIGDGCDALGCASEHSIELMSIAPRPVFLHELGHVFDWHEMTDADRARFIGITGRPDLTWWDTPRFDHGWMAGEWFADVYSICAGAKRIYPRWEYTVGSSALDGWRVQKSCWLIKYTAQPA